MVTSDLSPKTNTNLPSRKLNWVVQPASQAYTFEDIHGNLAEEISAALASSKPNPDPIPSIEPEDFEAAYQWFIS
jgi:hypothetical protein